MVRISCRLKHALRTLTVLVQMLALCSISPATQAWRADTVAPWLGTTLDGMPCKSGQVSFGPFDYLERDKDLAALQVVEESHFSTDTENLIDSGYEWAMNDIHYTLQVWPNHHRALNSALKYRLQFLWNWDAKARIPPAECYLQRAIKFSPKDPKPYMMYGVLLQKTKQHAKALNAYRTANRLMPNDVITQYNMGLTLVELKQYAEAKQLAEKVYGAGFPLPALKNKLIAAGQWNTETGEPVANPAKQELTPAQVEAIKKAMQNPTPAQVEAIKKAMENSTPAQKDALEKAVQDEAARKQAAPVAAAP